MIIISHRGFWIRATEKNTLKAFKNSTKFGFGTETDIRDFNSELVISHDVADKNSVKFNTMLEPFQSTNLLLALNIKADGLLNLLQLSMNHYNIKNYFVFDMSIPDTLQYIKAGFNVFSRQSEYELQVPFYNDIKGIWLDAFKNIWYDADLIKKHLNNGKQVCIVSAELHNRDYLSHWKLIKSWDFIENNNLILCTDYPEEAKIFFNRI